MDGRTALWALVVAVLTAVSTTSCGNTYSRASDASGGAHAAAMSVGLFADAQYCDCAAKNGRYYRASLRKLSAAVDTFNAHDVDFAIHAGDLIDRYPRSFDAILPVYARFDGPRRHVLGNHDFPLESADVVARLGMANEYYRFDRPGWRFVVLDTNDISLYANVKGSADYQRALEILDELSAAGAPNARNYNGAVGEEQLRWLRTVLRTAAGQDRRVMVFGHMPVHGRSTHNAWDDAAIRRALRSAGNVVAYFSGHDHAGGYGHSHGIHHVGLRGMVERPATSNAYAVMHVYADRLQIDGFGREPDRTLTISPEAR